MSVNCDGDGVTTKVKMVVKLPAINGNHANQPGVR